MALRPASRILTTAVLATALVLLFGANGSAFVPSSGRPAAALGVSSGFLAASLAAAPPAFAGEPPSVGDHWYWDLGFGSLHGETASIILMVFFLLVVFSLLGAGGSSKKSAA
eukprot:CAMPEP_0113821004 /NCGR_PEP_ID=MMETSP0328-20130328/1521_1 /TAXON_ID=39455 /ORGANISM="Alexandrium minutum" /LENGTH=111 /DNA_ID=CAMNT_0000788935 /DNA_START=106 /DNA_END=441 /DNA_ORIENTATION=- /assembly_acc=CAM_ASM_000350